MKLPHAELNPAGVFFEALCPWACPVIWENRVRKIVVFVVDVLRPLPYLAGLLNRMDIKAIAASPSFATRTWNQEAWETPHSSRVA
jgi:hypothetical protein